MVDSTASELASHLLRADGQEDICLAVYRPSTGRERDTALIADVLPPRFRERAVHGNASVTGDYVMRAAFTAAKTGGVTRCRPTSPGSGCWSSAVAP